MRCSHVVEAKRALRARLIEARRSRSPADLAAAAAGIAAHGVRAWAGASVVAGYAGVGTEPPTRALLDGLVAAGVQVRLPVVDGEQLRWGGYAGWDGLVPGRFGLLEPAAAPWDSSSLRDASIVVVPALAVDRHGHRLGRGGGYVDRALAGLATPAVAVVYDEELVDELPVDDHDVPVVGVLTPTGLRLW